MHTVKYIYERSDTNIIIDSKTINGGTILKKGVHNADDIGWGYQHLVTKRAGGTSHIDDIARKFNLDSGTPDEIEKKVFNLIEEAIQRGTKNPNKPIEIYYQKNNEIIKVVLSTDSPGSIQSVYPTAGWFE